MNFPECTSHPYPGTLIVIEAAAASGKDTQTDFLVKTLREQGVSVFRTGFPRYSVAPYGPRILTYLENGYGLANELVPEYASYPYLLDRILAAPEIIEHLTLGETVVVCRYVLSNLVYQGAKVWSQTGDLKAAETFITEQYTLEYSTHQLPREDFVLYLDLPWSVSKKLLEERSKKTGEGRDGHEMEDEHMERINRLYQNISDSLSYSHRVTCATDDQTTIRSITEISADILALITTT